ncbi:MAG TPA: 3-hexulose-6-phosphate synthase [Sedimentisphaerales bacterium]|nr:3-hexulose-6-phosphate synthase [Sedimentisphaerales bacterium]
MTPILQVALDFVDLLRALKLAEEAVEGGADWLEAGTPLIKSVGLDCVRALRKKFPRRTIVADMKTMDVGRMEVESAAKAGADIVAVLGVASDSTIKECIQAGGHYGAKIMVDLLEVSEYLTRAKKIEQMGADYLGLHASIDEQMRGKISFEKVSRVAQEVNIPVAVAGGIHSENACQAVEAGATILIVGGAITKSEDAQRATQEIKKAIDQKISIKTELFKRITYENISEILEKVSTANISDAIHRQEALRGIFSITSGTKMVGRAVTVRTYPGDWAKPVEAIDQAEEGDVIVVDAGGVGPAVWGELASHSAQQKNLAGVVIDGAVRDITEIRRMKFPAFVKMITPAAGEPKGFGEIGVPVNISGTRIFPGDWVIGDDDGVIIIQNKKAVEFTNRAMDVLERENRIRREIEGGGTLGKVTELLKWEKR